MDRDCRNARATVRRAAEVRRSLARNYPPDRDARLTAALDDLTAAMGPIRARLLRAPKATASYHDPDARKASAALQAERRRVTVMLRRRPGGARQPRTPERPITLVSFRGHVGAAKSRAAAIRADMLGTDDMPAGLAAPGGYAPRGSKAYREDAEEWLDKIDAARWNLKRARRSLRRRFPNGLPVNRANERVVRRLRAVERELDYLRSRARRAADAPITHFGTVRYGGRPKPPKQSRRHWDADSARAALDAWAAEYGRYPSARELAGNPALPSYGKVHELLGGLPSPVR